VASVERRAIQFALKEGGGRAGAAHMLGLPEPELAKKMKALEIEG
jgi:DNA-binding NtrC family response regulator